MEFKNRVKNRRLKRYLTSFIKVFKFRGLNLSTSQKIILFGIISNFVSLFFPWVNSIDRSISETSFSDLSGNIGMIILLILIFLLFNLFSINSKEKVQLHIGIHFKDYPVSIILGIFIIVLSIVSINFIEALQAFSSNIVYGSGMILSITSGIIIVIGGIIQRLEFNKYSSESNLCDPENENLNLDLKKSGKNNMKLPF